METVAIITLAIIAAMSIIFALIANADYKDAAKRLESLQFTSPYARLLGRTVDAKVYEGSKWERMVVVAVSWRGAVAVRPVSDLSARARWIHKNHVPQRVRELSDGQNG